MTGDTLKQRAISFAFGAGALVFILTMLALVVWPSDGTGRDVDQIARALSIAVVCATLSWAGAERTIAVHAAAVDAISERLGQAAAGDLMSPPPPAVGAALPEVSLALEAMFARMRRHLDRVSTLALYDAVTGLPNRINFREEAERRLAQALPKSRLALLFVDLDRFKAVNDNLGHAIGDQLLSQVAQRILRAAEDDEDALVARLSGDEFVVLLGEGSGPSEAMHLGHAIVASLSEPFQIDGHEVSVGASVGAAIRPGHGTELSPLMKAADIAMYQAKAEGRGCARMYTSALADSPGRHPAGSLDQPVSATGEVAFALHQGLDNGEVRRIQALWRRDSGEVSGVLPDEDLLAALESRMTPLAVALDARQLADMGLRQRLCRAAAQGGVTLLVEEQAMDQPATAAVIAALRSEGAQIGVRGFGGGGIALDRLAAFAPDLILLAPNLTVRIAIAEEARLLVAALAALGRAMGCPVGAEAGDADLLRAAGCDFVALPADAAGQPSARAITSA